jgi:hypothetical protein
MRRDAEGEDEGFIVPALVVEYAEYGTVKTYQDLGYARPVLDKIDILLDAGLGLQALRDARLIHSDMRTSDLLACKYPSRKFIVKLTGFGYSFTQGGEYIVDATGHLEAVEAHERLDSCYAY